MLVLYSNLSYRQTTDHFTARVEAGRLRAGRVNSEHAALAVVVKPEESVISSEHRDAILEVGHLHNNPRAVSRAWTSNMMAV